MSLSITLPGFELSLSRGAAYIQIGGLFEASLTPAASGGSFWDSSRFEVGAGFQLVAGPLAFDIGRP